MVLSVLSSGWVQLLGGFGGAFPALLFCFSSILLIFEVFGVLRCFEVIWAFFCVFFGFSGFLGERNTCAVLKPSCSRQLCPTILCSAMAHPRAFLSAGRRGVGLPPDEQLLVGMFLDQPYFDVSYSLASTR